MENLRGQIEAVIRLAETATTRPTPKSPSAAAELLSTVAQAQDALALVVAEVRAQILREPPVSEREARALYLIAQRLCELGDCLRSAAARIQAAISRHSRRN